MLTSLHPHARAADPGPSSPPGPWPGSVLSHRNTFPVSPSTPHPTSFLQPPPSTESTSGTKRYIRSSAYSLSAPAPPHEAPGQLWPPCPPHPPRSAIPLTV